jgi:hypothetical protein
VLLSGRCWSRIGVSFSILGLSTAYTLSFVELYNEHISLRSSDSSVDNLPLVLSVGYVGDTPSCSIRATISAFVLQSS